MHSDDASAQGGWPALPPLGGVEVDDRSWGYFADPPGSIITAHMRIYREASIHRPASLIAVMIDNNSGITSARRDPHAWQELRRSYPTTIADGLFLFELHRNVTALGKITWRLWQYDGDFLRFRAISDVSPYAPHHALADPWWQAHKELLLAQTE